MSSPERAVSEPSEVIAPEHLQDISTDLWGAAAYAGTAALFLDKFAGYQSLLDDRYDPKDQLYNYRFEGFQLDRLVSDTKLSSEQVERWVHGVWLRKRIPYGLNTDWSADYDRWSLRIEAGPLEKDRLAHWSMEGGYSVHRLHGGLGKAADVLNVAAGVISADEVKRNQQEDTTEYIPYATFLSELESTTKISDYYKRKLGRRAHAAVQDQLFYPIYRPNEVIVEGDIQRVGLVSQATFTFDRIALSSLRTLGDFLQEPSKVDPFLRQF